MSMNQVSPLPLTLGRQFANARENAGLDQAALGAALGFDRSTISRWERDRQVPPFTAVVKLAEMSGWPLELFARAQTPSEPTDPAGGSVMQEESSACNHRAEVIDLFTKRVA